MFAKCHLFETGDGNIFLNPLRIFLTFLRFQVNIEINAVVGL